jgi:transcriptional regulator with XRE-family HTH domain
MVSELVTMTLARYLADHALTRAAFAASIGVSRVTLQRYLAGDRFPRPEVLRKIATVTAGKVTANDFMASTTGPQSPAPKAAA